MRVQFEWQAGSDSGDWEVVARTERDRWFRWLRRVPWWGWVGFVALLAALTGGGYAVLRSRYEAVLRRVEFQLQSAIDLEARAFAQRDRDLFLDQQDDLSPDWYARQRRLVSSPCAWMPVEEDILQYPCSPVLPAQIQKVELNGDIAWVEVIEGQSPVRRVRFYRQTGLGWKHTAPRVEWWDVAVELHYGPNMLFRYHRRDLPYIEPLIEHMATTFRDVCAMLGCSRSSITVGANFAVDVFSPMAQLPRLSIDEVILPSPWLSGIPVDGTWPESYLDELEYWMAYTTAAQVLRSSPYQSLSQLQRSILDEYAVWYSQRDAARAPIISRVVERQGVDALPEVFRWLKDTRRTHNLEAFVHRWL